MENATKALLIAAGVFMGVMIISLGIYLYASLGSYVEKTSQDMEANALNKFNTQFLNYINYQGGEYTFELKMQDIITVASIAYENNQKYEFLEDREYGEADFYVTVNITNASGSNIVDGDLQKNDNLEKFSNMLKEDMVAEAEYRCTTDDIKISPITGRVYEINFRKI